MSAINIIFDSPPGPESNFVEIEDDFGNSIGIGEWFQKDEFWVLRIEKLPE